MQRLEFTSAGGHTYTVMLPEPRPGIKSAYLFSFHKSGSTLMDNMVWDYCEAQGVPTFSLFNSAFDSGVPTSEILKDAKYCFSREGRIYTGFRHYPLFDMDLKGVQCVLLVRDPRDMLVSLYFSLTKSHVVPVFHQKFKQNRTQAAQLELDDFVLQKAPEYLNSFNRYQQLLPAESLTTYRYEDVIYKKRIWLSDLVNKLDLPLSRRLIDKVAKKHDVFPNNEDESQHIRQVHPGNYRVKLKPETISSLNDTLRPFLNFFGYETS